MYIHMHIMYSNFHHVLSYLPWQRIKWKKSEGEKIDDKRINIKVESLGSKVYEIIPLKALLEIQ
jgi:hypothetical protein